MPFPDATYPCDQRLAKAAPDMLAALRLASNELIAFYEDAYEYDETDKEVSEAIDAMTAAIAKAEGRSE